MWRGDWEASRSAALDTIVGLLPPPKGARFIGQAAFGSGNNVLDQRRRFQPVSMATMRSSMK
jgi:hypothetical protein